MKINEVLKILEIKGRYHWVDLTSGDFRCRLGLSMNGTYALRIGEDTKVYKIDKLPLSLTDDFEIVNQSIVKPKKVYEEKEVDSGL